METLEENLRLMTSKEKYGMYSLRESIGGNAGTWREHSCWAANFYFDTNGKIKLFGNPGDVPKEIEEKYFEGTFKIAKRAGDLKDRIVKLYVSKYVGEKERFARAVLLVNADEFNERYGFEVE